MAVCDVAPSTHQQRKKRFIMPAVTVEMASKVGEMVGQGLKLETALAALEQPLSLEHWKRALGLPNTGSSILRAFQAKAAQAEMALLAQVAPSNKGWQAAAWRLERSRGYSVQRGPSVVVNVNTINGVDNDILKRAKTHVAAKPIKAIDVK